MNECDVSALVYAVCRGLIQLHSHGYYPRCLSFEFILTENEHRDLRGENVLITADNQIKLSDWGPGRWSNSAVKPNGRQEYMAPETRSDDQLQLVPQHFCVMHTGFGQSVAQLSRAW